MDAEINVDDLTEELELEVDDDNGDDNDELSGTEEISAAGDDIEEEPQNEDEEENEPLDDDDGFGDAEFIRPPRRASKEMEIDNFLSEMNLPEDPVKSRPSIHISQMDIQTKEHAKEIAEEIILTLEQDVVAYLKKHKISLDGEIGLASKISDSSVSISSDPSETLPGEPSKLRLFYEKGQNMYRELPISKIEGRGIDEMVEVNLHRKQKYEKPNMGSKTNDFTQTKNFAFVPDNKAQFIFMDIYPQPEGFVKPETPPRKKSMSVAVEQAVTADPAVDRNRQGPKIINFSNRKKLLQPLRDDYYKEEKFWTGSRFKGEYKDRQFFKGHYDHPTGIEYESEWKNGHFHCSKHTGIIQYPRGDTFEGTWVQGRCIKGEITFGEGLKYNDEKWSYCEAPDRRFRVERQFGLKPAGVELHNDQFPQLNLPSGAFDVGDGIFDPNNNEVRRYDGILLRIADAEEKNYIMTHFRKAYTADEEYIPKFHPDRIPKRHFNLI